MLKYLTMFLLLSSNMSTATVVSVTQCSVPILHTIMYDSMVWVVTHEQLKESPEMMFNYYSALTDDDVIIKADEQYPVVCPHTASKD